MKTTEMNPVLMIWEDYFELRRLVPLMQSDSAPLSGELSRAILLRNDAFPPHAIRMYSHVTILDVDKEVEHCFCIVLPEEADETAGKLSVLTPMATAIIGFRKGEEITWPFPGGVKRLKILEVRNNNLPLSRPSLPGLPIHH
jgi:regulator of nucleoside diphosphate kinase